MGWFPIHKSLRMRVKIGETEMRKPGKADPPPTWILIAAEPMTDVDTTASDVLEELDEALNDQGISLVFAEPTNGTAPPHGFRAGS